MGEFIYGLALAYTYYNHVLSTRIIRESSARSMCVYLCHSGGINKSADIFLLPCVYVYMRDRGQG